MMLGVSMRIQDVFKKKWISGLFLILSVIYMPPAVAVTLNFSAILTDGTCEISVNKSVLSLGDVSASQLKANKMVAAQPFQLNIQNCVSVSASTAFSIKVSGTGRVQDGKWLFGNSNGAENGPGIMLVQSSTLPDYSNSEIRDGSTIAFGEKGITPPDQSLTFYAGVSCGGNTGCATVTPGTVSATVMFDLEYR